MSDSMVPPSLVGLMMAMPLLREDFTYIPSAAIHHTDQYIIITRSQTLTVLKTWIKRHRHHLEDPVNSGRGLSVLVQPGLTNVCSAAVISSCPAQLRCFMSVTFLSDGYSIIPGSSNKMEWWHIRCPSHFLLNQSNFQKNL